MLVSALDTDKHLRGLELALLFSSQLCSPAAMSSCGVRVREHLNLWSWTEEQHDPLAVPP